MFLERPWEGGIGEGSQVLPQEIPETSSENLPPWVLDGLTVDFLNLPGGRTTLVDPLLRGIFSWIER